VAIVPANFEETSTVWRMNERLLLSPVIAPTGDTL